MERVLHVIGRMDRAGAETLIMNLYRNIDRTRFQFDFLVHTDDESDYDKEILSLGGKIYRLPTFTLLNYFSYRKACQKFFLSHPEHRIVHGHIGSTSAIYLGEAKKLGCFTIAHSHSLNYETGIMGIAFSVLTRPTRNIADFFIGCSDEAGIDRFGFDVVKSNRYLTLINGIEVDKYVFSQEQYEKKRIELGIGADQVVFCHVGRFAEVKNHKFLIEVFNEIHKKKPNAILLLSGKGEQEEKIKRQVEDLGLQSVVKFLGLRSDVSEILIASNCFLFPSFSEGLAISVVEAQAAGLPSIVSEGVPNLTFLTPLVKKVPLNLGAEVWANEAIAVIEKAKNQERSSIREQIIDSGFDIKESTIRLCELYNLKQNALYK
ncbi:MAG: glycosyltransferase family 1 protein [Anaerotardibacter sp.]